MYQQQKNDAMVQTRVKTTVMATIARYFATRGMIVTSKSFLMRVITEEFEKMLINNNITERVTDIIDAREILAKLGLEDWNPDGRLGRNFMEEQQQAVYEYEGWDTRELTADRTKSNVAAEIKEMEELARNPERLRQSMEGNLAPRVSKQAERSKSEHDALGDVNNVPIEGEDNGQT